MFLNLDEAFGVIGQLADIALRRLLDSEGLELDRVLQQPTRITKRSDTFTPSSPPHIWPLTEEWVLLLIIIINK